MRSTFLYLVLIVVTAFFTASCDKNNGGRDTTKLPNPIVIELRSAEKEMVQSDQQFAFDFFAHVFEEEALDDDKDFMVSPLSLGMALSMTRNGAAGETEKAMQQTLQMGNYTGEEINSYYKKLKEALLKTDPTTKLSIANAIFTNKRVVVHADFLKSNQSYYDATVQSVDFSDSATAGLINNWASDQTNGLIKKVIDRTDAFDLMYLLNALYFKGIWATQFDAKNTIGKPFIRENGTTIQVEMMRQKNRFLYAEDQFLQMVQLPYGNKAFSMMVLLPKKGALKDIVFGARESNYWHGLKSSLREAEVDLSLPKFKTEYSKKLNDVLTKMGMGIAFTDGANFTGITDVPAKISFVKQDTYISTDESGTEAAAVTTVGMELTSMPTPPKKVIFNAERPFIYIIQENSTGAILFMGAVKNFDK
ncbi:MAG: serpin family protein [Proteiniphilum sp.]|jgi:serine protease inhibitor|nr:serpin family protein [Proteiniphilum sp.]NCB24356.1 serpin family protein [Bacteroidia bacterium]